MRTRVTVEGFDGWILFANRYRDVNTYAIHSKGELGPDRIQILDDGTLYQPEWIGAVTKDAALRAVAEYERLCWKASEKRANEKGYSLAGQSPHAICAVA